jgi:aminoglycoside phosphotransferase (APT) family kinase protein
MGHALLALTLGLAYAATPNAPDARGDITPEESARLNAEHAEACARLTAAVDAIEALRLAYPKAPDPDKHLIQWEAAFAPAHKAIGEQEALWLEQDGRKAALEVTRITRAVSRFADGEAIPGRLTADFEAILKDATDMRARQDRALRRFWAEGDILREAHRVRAEAKRKDKEARRLVLWVGGAAALLAAVFAVAAWRHARPELPAAPLPPLLAAPDPAASRALPALIGGNIDIVRPIGRGGMGEVYEGLDRTLQRRVALKRLRPELTGSPSDLSRLLNEARLVAALKHPNIVAIHSVEREAGQVFLVFEYVDGPTLAAVISQRRRLPWREALGLYKAAAGALDAAHRQNIIHRDLKPGNIMLDSKGVVKVMDFGIAHEAARAVSKLTSSGAWGTPPYMSPEQELGEVNTGVDLFALNVVLYEMLTGEVPFTGPNFLAQKREGVYVAPSKAVPAPPKALDAFFATAFDPDPVKRFHDTATLAAAANSLI